MPRKGWLSGLFKSRRRRYRRRCRDTSELDENTQQRTFRDQLRQMEKGRPDLAGLLSHMYDKGWNMGDIFSSMHSLETKIFSTLSAPPQEVIDLIDRAIECDSLRQEYQIDHHPPQEQLEMVVDAMHAAIESDIPSFVYTDVWGRWHGRSDSRRNSRKFAVDISESVKSLKDAKRLTRKARALLVKKVERIVDSPQITYGDKIGKVASALLKADPHTHGSAYVLANAFHERDYLDECPLMYMSLMKLPDSTPAQLLGFIDYAMGFIEPSERGISNRDYVDDLQKLIYKIATVLRGESKVAYTPEYIAQLFTTNFTEDQAENLIKRANRFIDDMMSGSKDVRDEDMRKLLPEVKDALFDANAYIMKTTKNLTDMFGEREAEYFKGLADNLRDTENSLDLIAFCVTHFKKTQILYGHKPEEPLSPFELRLYREKVSKASKERSKKQDERNRLIEIIQDPENNGRKVPKHVADFYRDHYGIKVRETMLDIGKDNKAWYKFAETAGQYYDLNDAGAAERRVVPEDIDALIQYLLVESRLVREQRVANIGYACGDAWPEIVFTKKLASWYFNGQSKEHFNVWLKLFDINQTMIDRASNNCNDSRIPAYVRRKNILNIVYDDLGPLHRQLVFTMFGRTYFNLETGSDKLIDSLIDISHEHRVRGIKSPTVIVLEGVRENNMEYYWDTRAENMHVKYFLRQLESPEDVICFDNSITQQIKFPHGSAHSDATSTYAAIQTPEQDRVEFYLLTLKPARILGGDVEPLRQYQVIRCGESRVLSEQLMDSFEEKGIFTKVLDKPSDPNSVFIVLAPGVRRSS